MPTWCGMGGDGGGGMDAVVLLEREKGEGMKRGLGPPPRVPQLGREGPASPDGMKMMGCSCLLGLLVYAWLGLGWGWLLSHAVPDDRAGIDRCSGVGLMWGRPTLMDEPGQALCLFRFPCSLWMRIPFFFLFFEGYPSMQQRLYVRSMYVCLYTVQWCI